MLEKEKYESPEMEIVQFEIEDIITSSGGVNEGGDTDLSVR